MVWQYDDPRWARLDRSFIVLMAALFTASVLSWRGVHVFGSGAQVRPLSLVFLTGAMLLQSVSGFFSRKRRYAVSYPLLALSLVGLWFGVTTRS